MVQEQDPTLLLDLQLDFDINAAFQEAVSGVMGDEEMKLDEKVRRMEVIIQEGTSEVYNSFVDFRMMAAQIEMFCNHDHALNQAQSGSDTISAFMKEHSSRDGHEHDGVSTEKDDKKPNKKKEKKKKRRRGLLDLLLKEQ